MPKTLKTAPEDMLPLKPADFHILMVLLNKALHGNGIMRAVEVESDGRVLLEVGTMYRRIARLMDEGLMAESKRRDSDRRRFYRITPLGKQVAKLKARRLPDVVQVARAHDLLSDGEGL